MKKLDIIKKKLNNKLLKLLKKRFFIKIKNYDTKNKKNINILKVLKKKIAITKTKINIIKKKYDK